MQRYDFYLQQLLTENELDSSFDAAENAIGYLAAAAGVYGLQQNGAVTEKSGTPNMSVDISGPLVAYDSDGQRIAIAALTNLVVSVDENSVSTTVATPGNERYLSVFVKFERSLSDPRLDGNGDTVFYNRAESYELAVVQAADAPVGTASRPALRADSVLLADILIVQGQTSVLNADVLTDRTQYMVRLTGTPNEIARRTVLEALQDLEDQVNDVINGVVTIAAASVTYAGSGNNWADGTAVASANVEAALDEVVTDLASGSGAAKVGFAPVGTLAATTVQAAIAELDSELSDAVGVGACGATKVGFAPQGSIAAATTEGAIVEVSGDVTALQTYAFYTVAASGVGSGAKCTLTEVSKNGAFVLASNEVAVPTAGVYEIQWSGTCDSQGDAAAQATVSLDLNVNAVSALNAMAGRITDGATSYPTRIAGSYVLTVVTPASEKISIETGAYTDNDVTAGRLVIRRIL